MSGVYGFMQILKRKEKKAQNFKTHLPSQMQQTDPNGEAVYAPTCVCTCILKEQKFPNICVRSKGQAYGRFGTIVGVCFFRGAHFSVNAQSISGGVMLYSRLECRAGFSRA